MRGIANTIIGMSYYLKRFPEDEEIKELMYEMTYKLINIYNIEKSDDWNWFEDILTYDNAIIPLAIFHAAEVFNDNMILKSRN